MWTEQKCKTVPWAKCQVNFFRRSKTRPVPCQRIQRWQAARIDLSTNTSFWKIWPILTEFIPTKNQVTFWGKIHANFAIYLLFFADKFRPFHFMRKKDCLGYCLRSGECVNSLIVPKRPAPKDDVTCEASIYVTPVVMHILFTAFRVTNTNPSAFSTSKVYFYL